MSYGLQRGFGYADSLEDHSVGDLAEEVLRARAKFPDTPQQRRALFGALAEEFLELTRAMLDGEGLDRVRQEALQTACVAMRIYEELTDAELSAKVEA